MSDLISMSPSEAQAECSLMLNQLETARTSIETVMKTRDRLSSFKGGRSERFKAETEQEMARLRSALEVIQQLKDKLNAAIQDFISVGN